MEKTHRAFLKSPFLGDKRGRREIGTHGGGEIGLLAEVMGKMDLFTNVIGLQNRKSKG